MKSWLENGKRMAEIWLVQVTSNSSIKVPSVGSLLNHACLLMIAQLDMLLAKKNANVKFLSKTDQFQSLKDLKIFKSSMVKMLISKSGFKRHFYNFTEWSSVLSSFSLAYKTLMKAELSVEGGSFRILYDGQELRRSDQIQISQVYINIEKWSFLKCVFSAKLLSIWKSKKLLSIELDSIHWKQMVTSVLVNSLLKKSQLNSVLDSPIWLSTAKRKLFSNAKYQLRLVFKLIPLGYS